MYARVGSLQAGKSNNAIMVLVGGGRSHAGRVLGAQACDSTPEKRVSRSCSRCSAADTCYVVGLQRPQRGLTSKELYTILPGQTLLLADVGHPKSSEVFLLV